MARSCGIRIGPRRFEIVVLDGSPKRHKIAAYYAGDFDPEATEDFLDGNVAGVGATLKAAAKTHRIPKENVTVVMDTGHAAFRRVTLPFSDKSKIDQVLKFEVENQLPQWNIDDVVIDYHITSSTEAGSELLVSAVPKEDVQRVIDACERAGIEPLEVELETSSIVNAAMSADLCHIDDAQLLVHIGETSTSVVVVDSGEVREMRVIHIGALSHEQGPLPSPANEDGLLDDDEETERGPTPMLDPIEVSRRIDQAIKRIRRELGRTMSAARTINSIEAIYVCGMELPGLIGGNVLDVPVYLLDCFDEDSGQPADGYGQLVAAYGGAFRQLGGGSLKPSLRREELRYTGAWERLEFPIAIACLLLATFLGMINIVQIRELRGAVYGGALIWLQSSNNYALGNPRENKPGAMKPPPEELKQRAAMYEIDPAKGEKLPPEAQDPLEELRFVAKDMKKRVLDLQTDLGEIQDVPQPQSAFVAMTLVLGVLDSNKDEWRASIRRLESSYVPPRSGKDEHVRVEMDVTFFAAGPIEASADIIAFKDALKSQKWVKTVEPHKNESIEGDAGYHIPGFTVLIDVNQYYASQQ